MLLKKCFFLSGDSGYPMGMKNAPPHEGSSTPEYYGRYGNQQPMMSQRTGPYDGGHPGSFGPSPAGTMGPPTAPHHPYLPPGGPLRSSEHYPPAGHGDGPPMGPPLPGTYPPTGKMTPQKGEMATMMQSKSDYMINDGYSQGRLNFLLPSSNLVFFETDRKSVV